MGRAMAVAVLLLAVNSFFGGTDHGIGSVVPVGGGVRPLLSFDLVACGA